MVIRALASYQGGKTRTAREILDIIKSKQPNPSTWTEVCCGCGVITLNAIKEGYVHPRQVTMVDHGPWGRFWSAISQGKFCWKTYDSILAEISDSWENFIEAQRFAPRVLKRIASRPVPEDNAEFAATFILLQSASFRSKPITMTKDGCAWTNTYFGTLWLPTATSKRRSHSNVFKPLPSTQRELIKESLKYMRGVTVVHGDAMDCPIPIPESVVYIDPPYEETTGYFCEQPNVGDWLSHFCVSNNHVFVSEKESLTEAREYWQLTSRRHDPRKQRDTSSEFISWFHKT